MLTKLQDHSSPHRLWVAALSVWYAVMVVATVALWHMHRSAIDMQMRETRLISFALADEIARGLQGVKDGLFAMRDDLRSGQVSSSGPQGALERAVRYMPTVRTLWYVDNKGGQRYGSDASHPPDPRSFFPTLESLGNGAIAVSAAFTDPATRESFIALAARADGKIDGSGGWIIAGVPVAALYGAFHVASPGADARMAVYRNDGLRLAGRIDDGARLGESTLSELLTAPPRMEKHVFSDGTERLVSIHSLPQYGLKLMVTRDLKAALQTWHDVAFWALLGIVLLSVVLIVSVRRIARSDRRYAEARDALRLQKSRAGKFEALGTLASGVAHDFNNVLAAIVGFGEMARDAAPPGSSQARHLDKVMQAALRGKALIGRILKFSRTGAHTAAVFRLEPIVDEVLSLLESSLPAGVRVERYFDAGPGKLRGDPTQAFEAVMNLCTNAIQAMPEGGKLRVSIMHTTLSVSRLLSHGELAPGAYLALSVADEGLGMNTDVMERLFEPFFTTRGDRSGTGLGLAVVHGVVGEFHGAINVESAVGRGSQFTLYFPESQDELTGTASLPESAVPVSGQRLMIVDDEPDLVALTQETLNGLGYECAGFCDPKAALAALREDPKQFAAIITDEVMPTLCGTRFTQALRACAPDVPVLLVSGCGGSFLASRAAAVGVTRVLAKPLERADLQRALIEVLPSAAREDGAPAATIATAT